MLGEYARERRLFSLETAVHKMTGMAATRLGLRERGLVQPGYFADLTVFDPATVKDESTYAEPHRYPTGIPYVLVNGAVVVDNGRMARAARSHPDAGRQGRRPVRGRDKKFLIRPSWPSHDRWYRLGGSGAGMAAGREIDMKITASSCVARIAPGRRVALAGVLTVVVVPPRAWRRRMCGRSARAGARWRPLRRRRGWRSPER